MKPTLLTSADEQEAAVYEVETLLNIAEGLWYEIINEDTIHCF